MALSAALKKKLAAANKNWTKAKTRAETEKSAFEEIPDGRYLARLTGAEVNESKSSGRLQVQWQYKIVDGDYKGQTKMCFDGLETEDNLMYLARTFGKYGYEAPDDLEQVDALLTALVKEKPLTKVRLKTKGGSDFQNLYVDDVFDKADEAEVLAEAASEDTDDDAADADTDDEATEEATEDDAEAETDDEATEEDATDATEEEGDTEITVGMELVAEWKGQNVLGTVLEILADEGKVRLKTAAGPTIRVALDKLSMPEAEDAADEATEEDDEDDVPEAPPAKAAKKVAPAAAPAKKPAAAPAKTVAKKK